MTSINQEFDFVGQANKLVLLGQFLESIDLSQITKIVGMAHSIGPFIDPTKYHDQLYNGSMDAIGDFAQALKEPLKIYKEKILPKVPNVSS